MKIISQKKVEDLETGNNGKKNEFENIISFYRNLITNPLENEIKGIERNQSAEDYIYEISRMLYDLLIKPIESEIKGKRELIIVPDGILAYIPFEALIDEKWLIITDLGG